MAKKKPEYQDIIKDHATALVDGMLAEARALATLEHQVTAGTYRELLIGGLLEHFLPSYLSISTGIIVNSKGEGHRSQSNQSDIIIYDNRVLPPFLKKPGLGLVPAESLIAVIEVKKKLGIVELRQAIKAACRTRYDVCDTGFAIQAVFAFEGQGPRVLQHNTKKCQAFLGRCQADIDCIVVAGAYSLIQMGRRDAKARCVHPEWVRNEVDPQTHEEVKRFVAVLLDRCRHLAHWRYITLHDGPNDWLSSYIRHQDD